MNTYRIYEDLRSSLGEEAAKSLAHTLGPMFEELGNTVTKAEFRGLHETVGRLADAQERTEKRVAELAEGQASLVAAQARTEARVTELAEGQAKLVAAQIHTEVRLAELTQAQARTEVRLAELTQAQARTEVRLAELTQAQARTEVRLGELTQAQAHTEARLAELTQAQAHTEVRLSELTEAQAHTEVRLAELTNAQSQTEVRLGELTAAQTRMQTELAEFTKVVRALVVNADRQATRLDAVLGRTFELQFRDRLTAYLGRLLRRGKLLRNDDVLDSIEQAVDAHDADELLRADAIASGLIDGVASHVVVEVSVACGVDDIDRAERRANILRKAGLPAVPLVACEAISPELVAYARSKQVRIWCNGSVLDAAA